MEQKVRNRSIDSLRFFLCINIVIHHVPGWFSEFVPYIDRSVTRLFVEFFFIVSGFFIGQSSEKKLLNVAKKEIINLWPLCALYTILYCITGKCPVDCWQPVLFLNAIGFSKDSFLVLWYVSVLFWVKLCFFYIKINCPKHLNFLIVLGIFFSILYLRHHTINQPVWGILPTGVLRGVYAMGLGVIISVLFKNFKLQSRTIYTYLQIIICLFLLLSIINLIKFRLSDFFIVLQMAILFYSIITKVGLLHKLLDNNIFSYLGQQYSYSVFICHTILFRLMKIFKIDIILNIKDHKTIFFCGIIILSILIGILIHHAINIPLKKYLSEHLKTYK